MLYERSEDLEKPEVVWLKRKPGVEELGGVYAKEQTPGVEELGGRGGGSVYAVAINLKEWRRIAEGF